MVPTRAENDNGKLFSSEGADRCRERVEMDSFYYGAIFSALQDTTPHKTRAVVLKKTNGKDSNTQQ